MDGGLAEHAATLGAHTYNPFQILKVGNYFNSLLRAETDDEMTLPQASRFRKAIALITGDKR